MKVHELAKELGITNNELIGNLKKLGIEVKSHLAALDDEVVEKVRKNVKKKEVKKSMEPKEQMHIIRRNVKVINTNGEKSEVEEISTSISGDIKKSHKTVVEKEKQKPSYNKEGLGVVKPRQNYAKKPSFGKNRTTGVVITRNGKPVEPVKPVVKEENKVESKPNLNENVKDISKEVNNDAPKIVESVKEQKERKDYKNQNEKRVNNFNRENRENTNNRKNDYKNQKGSFNKNSSPRPNNTSFNKGNNPNNNSQTPYRKNNNNRFNNRDNTSYQVNKFIKQSSSMPAEQKETREYSNNINIERKKYNESNKNQENRKEKLDKNKLREERSRVATSKLRGMEVNSSSGMLDLYERDSDFRKGGSKKKNAKVKKEVNQTKIIPMTEVKLPETMTVKEFAEKIKKQASEIIKKLFNLGIMATVNQDIDFDTAYLIASEFGITAEKEVVVTEEDILFDDSEDKEEDLKPRPPIVVVMGHVDHGKTSLLDRLRSAHVASGEAGGITQHIGAYKVKVQDKEICFLDTPGHEAFTAMRARGAQVTDVAIIVVAADDGIKPQTIEAIDHAKAAGVSIIVAINKIDKPTADVERVKRELLEVGLVPEEWGGDTICVPISALTGEGIDNLLEMVLLVAEMKNLRANPNKQAKGTVLEARLDKTKGTIVSMLVQRGQLNVGDTIVVGDVIGKVRAMKDDKGKKVKKAGPSTPVEILGLHEVPHTGDTFYEVEDEKTAKQLVAKKKAESRMKLIKQGSKVTLDDLFGQIKEGKIKELNVIIKADVQGSVEALKESLEKLSTDEVRVRVLHASTGGVTETDVTLASVSNAIIIGFNVRPEAAAKAQADKEKVDLRFYSVIYDAINDVEDALKGLAPKKYKEVMYGTAEVRKIFKITNVGIVAGCYVKSGKIVRNTMVRLVRDSIVLLSIKIDSLKREKDDVKEVAEGYECGIKLENYSDIKEGDIFECYEMVEEK